MHCEVLPCWTGSSSCGKGVKAGSLQRQWKSKWGNLEMTCFGIQPRLKTKLGSRMIFLGLLCFGFHLHLSKWVKVYGTPTRWGWRPTHKDVAHLTGSRSPGAVGREADRVLNDSQVRFV